MMNTKRNLTPIEDRNPLRVMYLVTSMPVGGAETLVVDLIRGLDRARFSPELCCLKELGPLGETLADEIPTFCRMLGHKFDVRVLGRLTRLLRSRRVDAVVTVGAGDKMFWGRLAAWRAGVPVVLSALHSTGWPDCVGRLNRLLTPLTDAFIAVADAHGRHLVEGERFPRGKVRVVRNGVDTERFAALPDSACLRRKLQLPEAAPVAGVVAALRPEKNHSLFLRSAALVLERLPEARFLVVGDGPERERLERLAGDLRINRSVHFLGTRSDVPALLSLLDVFVLTSDNEACPVSILEAMSVGRPVVATDVGSVSETVIADKTGYLVEPGDAGQVAGRIVELFEHPVLAKEMGAAARDRVVENWSFAETVEGYETLIAAIYRAKCNHQRSAKQPQDLANRPSP